MLARLGVLLIVAQVAVKAVPAPLPDGPLWESAMQTITTSVDQNLLPTQAEETHVPLQSLPELEEKYNVGNVSVLVDAMREAVDTLKGGEQGAFLRAKLGEVNFRKLETKLDMALPDFDAVKKEATALVNGKLPLQGRKMLLRRFIKRFSTTQSRFSDIFQDLAKAMGDRQPEQDRFFDRLQMGVLRITYEVMSYVFKKGAETSEHDLRSIQDLQ